jgi:phage protein D
MPATAFSLFLDGEAASPLLLEALQQIEIEDHADLADMMRLRLSVAVDNGGSRWSLLDDGLFGRLTRVGVRVKVGSTTEPLFEGHVIDSRTEFSNSPGQSVLEVVAMDPTVLMNLDEKIRPWPDMSDSEIAETLFGEYGFDPDVEATDITRQETDSLTMQRGTDLRFLRQLALRNGYEIFVEINTSTGSIEGHFHRPRLEQTPQGVLSVNLGPATNVNTFDARFDMLGPTTAQATGLDIETQEDQPGAADEIGIEEQGDSPTVASDRPRRVLLSQTGLSQTGELQTLAQAMVDRSASAIRADGELHTLRYGAVLRAKRPVEVRGAGRQFSGCYYVEKVVHLITTDGYLQQFSLRRNALGLTGRERFVEDDAL